MTVDLAFITYNRLEYTRLSLQSILADPSEKFALTIWDNASTDGTAEYLRNEVSDPRIADIILSRENVGQTEAINQVWTRSQADLVGKLDNDCLVTPGWSRTLARAHEDIPRLGVIACWHFFPEDFDYERAKHKIEVLGPHQIFRHPWTCGTGLLIKREDFRRFGPIQHKATTQYWLKMATAGRINGFYYPLIFQEHMDDPRSRHCRGKHMPFDEAYRYTYGYQTGALKDADSYQRVHREILDNLLDGSYNPRAYQGWRRRLHRVLHRATSFFNDRRRNG